MLESPNNMRDSYSKPRIASRIRKSMQSNIARRSLELPLSPGGEEGRGGGFLGRFSALWLQLPITQGKGGTGKGEADTEEQKD